MIQVPKNQMEDTNLNFKPKLKKQFCGVPKYRSLGGDGCLMLGLQQIFLSNIILL